MAETLVSYGSAPETPVFGIENDYGQQEDGLLFDICLGDGRLV